MAEVQDRCRDNTLCFYSKSKCERSSYQESEVLSLSESESPGQNLPFPAASVCNNWNKSVTVYSGKSGTGTSWEIGAHSGCVDLNPHALSVNFDHDVVFYPVTKRTKAHALPHGYPQCVSYKRETVHEILKEGYVCHVGFNYTEKNTQESDPYPVVLPTLYGIDTTTPEVLYLHGSIDARLYQTACDTVTYPDGVPVCLTVSLVDHMVVGARAFWNAVYYRSVMVYGTVTPVTDANEIMHALKSHVEHMFKGRWNDTRHPNERELASVGVLSLSLKEASAKVQDGTRMIKFDDDGPPGKGSLEYEEESPPTHWAGVIPVCQGYATPQPNAETIKAGIKIPEYLKGYNRPQTCQTWPE